MAHPLARARGFDVATVDADAALIVGAGVAGLFTALKLAPRPVWVLTAGRLGGGASSAWAQGGMAAALGPDDSAELHLADTVAAGAGLVDPAAARVLVEAAEARIEDLIALGVPFDADPAGVLKLGREAAHSRRRIVHASGDRAGAAIMERLTAAARAAHHIRILEGWAVEDLAVDDGRVCGALAAKVGDGRRVLYPAAHTILATGGVGGLYAATTNPPAAQGHGLAIAARAGAQIADAEFVQFHPTAIDVGRDPAPLATEALRGAGAVLVDKNGRRFMADIHPDAELAPRDVVARAVEAQRASGAGAYLDAVEAVGGAFEASFPTVYSACMAAGIDPAREAIPVRPAAHYHMGGVATDLDGSASAPGLWAVGEAASTGVHGANRLASNSLLEAVVFGARIAEALAGARFAAPPKKPAAPEDRLQLAPKPAAREALAPIREAMSSAAALIRTGAGLAAAQALIRARRAKAETSGLFNAAMAADLIVTAALARRESRGGHYRSDYPEPDAAQQTRRSLTVDALASDPAPAGRVECGRV